jgi:hypothetical protein
VRPPDRESRRRRAQIVEALDYPRRLMQGSIELDRCTHAGHYAHRDPACRTCEHGLECEWLSGHDEMVDLERKSLEALADALEVCFSFVDARVTLDGHDSARCRCEACSWLRDAERLLDALR